MAARVRYMRDGAGRWRWTLVAGNGEPVATSAEGDGYPTRAKARRAFRSAQRAMSGDTAEAGDEQPGT